MLRDYLIEGKEGTTNLKNLYKQLNKEYFAGSLPNIKVSWSGKLKKSIGRAGVRYFGRAQIEHALLAKYSETIAVSNVEIDMRSLKITLSKMFDLSTNDIKAIMLHEMVHIKLYTENKLGMHHGTPEFDGWIKRLSDQSGLEVPLKESNFKKSPKVKGKEGIAMILTQGDGKHGIATFTIPFMKKNWLIFAKTMTRIMNRSRGRITRMAYFKINHTAIVEYPAKRSLRKISWTMIDEELAREITKKGAIFGYSEIGGGRIIPNVIGIRENPVDIDEEGMVKW